MSAIAVFAGWVTLKLVVMFHVFLGMGLTEAVDGQFPASMLGAWLPCLAGHKCHLRTQKAAPVARKRLSFISLMIL